MSDDSNRPSLISHSQAGFSGCDSILVDLADPIAERGAAAVPFLVEQLKSRTDDLTVRDILLIFETMARLKSYDVKGDAALMNLLASKVAGVKHKEWRSVCFEMLQRIKHPNLE